jgi:ABC-type transporter Mla maintaining outer membrane lipid asymmetry ATPase subunit MlaF
VSGAIVSISSVTKRYGALRPLRIERLEVQSGELTAIVGLDQPAAEVFISLLTAAGLPDAGSVEVFGRRTTDIVDSAEWLAALDHFGIVSERAVLVDQLSVVQNLAMPYSLEIDPPTDEIRRMAIALAGDVGLPQACWDRPTADLDTTGRMRLRLARALTLKPALLLLDHPSATIPRRDVAAFAHDVRALARREGLAVIALTLDREFAEGMGARTLTLDPATGRLSEGWFGRIGWWR